MNNPKKRKLVIATIKSWNIEGAKRFSSKNPGTEVLLITNKEDFTYKKIKKFNPEYIFFPHWSWIISKDIYENFECVVFHMTDLPFGRGGSPLQNLIARGINKTKISAIRVVKGLDAGPVYLKRNLVLKGSATEIFKRTAKIIFNKMIPYIINEKPVPVLQKGKAVKFKRRTPQESNIASLTDINKIYDYIRMLDAEGYPKAFLEINKIRLEFSKAKPGKKSIEAKVRIEVKK